MSSCKEKLFQSGEICRVLKLPKQRFEYICNKLPLVPMIQAEGTGTANKYDFSAVYSCLVGDTLSKWGYPFRFISTELDLLKQRESALFEYCEEVQVFNRNSQVIWQVTYPFYKSSSEVEKGEIAKINSPLEMDKFPLVAKWLRLMRNNVPVTSKEALLQKEMPFHDDSPKTKIVGLGQEEEDFKFLDFKLNLSLLKYWLVSQL